MPASKRKKELVATPPSPVCLSLQKFSHATVVQNSVGPLPWNHIVSHGDIFALFETVRTLNADGTTTDSKRFKIVQDPNVMENLDLEVLATETGRAIDMARDASDHNRDHNAAVIKKVPVIAVKYPMSGRQVKRFQIRFTTDADFYEALKQFAHAGVHMLEAGTFPSTRPQTAQQSYEPAQRPMTSGNNVTTDIPALLASTARVADTSSNLMRPSEIPGISHIDTLQMQHHQPQSSVVRSANAQVSLMPSNNGYKCPPIEATDALDLQRAAHTEPVLSSRPAAIDLYTPRPSTAPLQVSQHLSQMLPPKRELPFNRPNAEFPEPKNDAAIPNAHALHSVAGNCADDDTATVETIIPNSQDSDITFPARKAALARTATKTVRQPAQAKSKSTRKEPAKRCDACKKKGARTRCRHKQQTPPLPSIEEVFQPGTTAAATELDSSKLDTQVLLTRAASTKKASSNKTAAKVPNTSEPQSTTRVTRSMSVAARESGLDASRPDITTHSAKSLQRPLSTFPCTPADQLINAHTPATPQGQAPSRISPQPPPALSHPQSQAGNEAEVTYERTINELSNVLDKQTVFADADRKLAAFASLSPDEQRDALEQWCIKMYKNTDFRALCRTLDRSHRAQLALTL